MRLLSLKFLSDHKQFKQGLTIDFGKASDPQEYLSTNLSVLIGRNGSGKTTIMSLIPTLFYHLERYNGQLKTNFEIRYLIRAFKKQHEVTISHYENLVRVSVPGLYDKVQLVPKKDAHKEDMVIIDKQQPYISFDLFNSYLPLTVVTSAFSVHGEYPPSRNSTFHGKHINKDQSITKIYGQNHYGLGSITRGIVRFLRLFYRRQKKIRSLLRLFDLRFNNKVLLRLANGEDKWQIIDLKWLNTYDVDIQSGQIILNDFEFIRAGRTIHLNNMSAGEKMLLLRAISILDAVEDQSIVIVEEPELHLDQVWNRQLTSLFNEFFSDYDIHLLVATHDYSVINSVHSKNLIFLEQGKEKSLDGTYLASYDELFSVLYGNRFRPNRIEQDILDKLDDMSSDELKRTYNELGNSIYKFLVFQQLKKKPDVES
jgi:ABC-type lipoprotein export system ATPase subunit